MAKISEAPSSGRHVFLVEDEKDMRESLTLVLESRGLRVTTACNGQEAVERIRELRNSGNSMDLLITDLQMPRMNGLALIETLKADGIPPPILVITGFGDKQTVVELMRKGCKEFIDKPFEPDEFLRRVDGVLSSISDEEAEKRTAEHPAELLNRKLAREVETYKRNCSQLLCRIDAAADAYRSFVNPGPKTEKIRTAFFQRSLEELGGDFADIVDTGPGCDIMVADVAGHDMGASYHSLLLKAFFAESVKSADKPEAFLRLLNGRLVAGNTGRRMVTAVFLHLDLFSMTCETASGAHPGVIRIPRFTGIPETIATEGDALGLDDSVSFVSQTFPIVSGDRIVLRTDGLASAAYMNVTTGRRVKFGEDGLLNSLRRHSHLPLNETAEAVWSDILAHCRNKPQDDMLLFMLEIP